MIPKKNRLLKKADFDRVFRLGKSFLSDPVLLRILGNDRDLVRVGISLGLKFSKKAVARNRLKRQIRAVFHKKIPDLKGGGYDLAIMIAKSRKERIETSELELAVEKVLRKANLL